MPLRFKSGCDACGFGGSASPTRRRPSDAGPNSSICSSGESLETIPFLNDSNASDASVVTEQIIVSYIKHK